MTPGFCRSEENRLKLGFLRGSLNKMKGCVRWQSITSENGISHVLVFKLVGRPHILQKDFRGKRFWPRCCWWMPVREHHPKRLLWNLQSLGAGTGMLNENSIQRFTVLWCSFAYSFGLHLAGTGWDVVVALPVQFRTLNVPFFPWALPGERWFHWDIISLCQSLRRVFKRTQESSSSLCSPRGFLLVFGV